MKLVLYVWNDSSNTYSYELVGINAVNQMKLCRKF